MQHQIVWVDIPVGNLDRAIAFYSAVLGTPVTKETVPGYEFGLLPHAQTNVAGCLYVPDQDNAPSKTGPLVYLNADGRLDAALEAVAANGGEVVQPKHQIGEHGWRAVVIDCEGNRIALHSQAA